MVDGGGAELARAEEWQVQRLPERATFQQGAAMGVPYGTAWRALFLKTKARPGETVLVHGASGGVGTAAVQIARAHGMRVIGTAGTDEGLRLVREQGAHEALNHREPDYLTKIPALTSGRGADVILEMMANVNLDRDLDVLAPHGRIMVIGNRGRVEIDPRKMMGKDGAILGMTLFNTTREEFARDPRGARGGTRERHAEPGDPQGDAARAGAAGARRGDGTRSVRQDRAGAVANDPNDSNNPNDPNDSNDSNDSNRLFPRELFVDDGGERLRRAARPLHPASVHEHRRRRVDTQTRSLGDAVAHDVRRASTCRGSR